MSVLYLDQVGGASGDMFLGLLVGLGADVTEMEKAIRRLGLGDVRLEAIAVERAGFPATHVRVIAQEEQGTPADQEHHHGRDQAHGHAHEHAHHHHRSLSEIERAIRGSGLPAPVIDKAVRVFRRLGEAEAVVHGVAIDDVHFHEVGALDSIADIVGTCWGLETLGITRLVSSPFLLGRGRVSMAHGTWPVPAPAVLRLIEGFPSRITDIEGETVTPTGAALITTLADQVGADCPMTVSRSAAGSGSREWPDRPNVLRGYLGTADVEAGSDVVEVLEASIDDMTGEAAGWLVSTLLEGGALDVTLVPVMMKKARPGFHITILAPVGRADQLAHLLFRESTTLGVRHRREQRWVLERRIVSVKTVYGTVRVKLATLPGGEVRRSPEYEDCARLAREKGVPLIDVMNRAREDSGRTDR